MSDIEKAPKAPGLVLYDAEGREYGPDELRLLHMAGSPGLFDVLHERFEQITVHGHLRDGDRVYHRDHELALAAIAYIKPSSHETSRWNFWPWPVSTFKPKTDGTPLENYRKNLVKGIALALAELERLDEILNRKTPQ